MGKAGRPSELQFQRMVADISTGLVGTPLEHLDRAIDHALMRIGMFFDADRSYVFQFSEDESALANTHEWCADGIEPHVRDSTGILTTDIPWLIPRILRHETVHISDVAALPQAAANETSDFLSGGIRSLLILPLGNEDRMFGFFGLDNVRERRDWSKRQVALLRIAVQVIVNALVKKQVDAALLLQAKLHGMMSEISLTFINLRAENVDQAIDRALMRIATFFDADRGYVLRFGPDLLTVDNTNEWCADHIEPHIDAKQALPFSAYPQWARDTILAGDVVHQPDVRKTSTDAGEQSIFVRHGVKSLLIIPLIRDQNLFGFLGLERIRNRQKWTDKQIAALTIFSEIVAGTFARRQADADLRLAAVAFESQEGMLVTDANGIIQRTNTACTRMTGWETAEVMGKTIDVFRSARHDDAFYADMWIRLTATGAWSGEFWAQRRNADAYPVWLTVSAVKDEIGEITHYVAMLTDMSQRKAAEDEINQLAFYDPLTQLPNRRLFLNRLNHALKSINRSGGHGALLLADLDNFSIINDTAGHNIGDQLLQLVAARLLASVREGDTVARLAADEFMVMLEDLSEVREEAASQVKAVGDKILLALNQSYQIAGRHYHSTASIGIALFADSKSTFADLLKQTDLAMYRSKAEGRNTQRFFDPEMQAVASARAALHADLRTAVHERQFVLYYQAQVDTDGCTTGAEALLRWQHPEHGMIAPNAFIPLAEETGLIIPIGNWVLQNACTQLAIWSAQPRTARLTVAVNVSAQQFRNVNFVDEVLSVLEQTGANPARLKLELTESVLVSNVEDVIAKMTALKSRGVGFSLDDFGTGYSSLSQLKRLPLYQLKIDQSFVRNILSDANDSAIARMVIALGESMGLHVIAEGVETAEQRAALAQIGCHAYQGYLFSRPIPVTEFEQLLCRDLARSPVN